MGTQSKSVENLSERIDQILQEIKTMDFTDYQLKKILELKKAIEAFHEDALRKLVRIVRSTDEGKRLMLEAVEEPSVYAMLLLHGIIKQNLYTKVAAVLEEVRPYLNSHGGDIELDKIEGNVVYVRMQGACSGCSLSAVTLKNGVEEAIKTRVQEIDRVEMVNDLSPGYMPLTGKGNVEELKDSGWKEGPDIEDLKENKPYYITIDGVDVLLIIIDNKIMAYRNRCPHRGIPFAQEEVEQVEGMYLIGHDKALRFDLTNGECITVPHIQLEPFPVRIEKKKIWIRVDS
ncbi:NifU family protein [Ureibacillus terrenus]|uniref:NifU family protein n=1 Tax=Ureibacillus terrenus TaxID=118246 RepID=UPI002E1CCA09|nr:NifU family protein [Ureibacillus terrenus]